MEERSPHYSPAARGALILVARRLLRALGSDAACPPAPLTVTGRSPPQACLQQPNFLGESARGQPLPRTGPIIRERNDKSDVCHTHNTWRTAMAKEATHPSHSHHLKAAEHHEHAIRHHKEAAGHYASGHHETAAHHAHTAHAHTLHATYHSGEAAKAHAAHGQKKA